MAASISYGQINAYKRRHKWNFSAEPSFGFYIGYTGLDNAFGDDVSDLLRWGLGLRMEADYQATAYAIAADLRMEYQQSHSSGRYPQKGPSILEFNLRPLYKLVRSLDHPINVSMQAGVYTALLPEVSTDEITIRKFFDPAALYEGMFIQQEYGYNEPSDIRVSYQVGYAFQQLVYSGTRDQSDIAATALSGIPAESQAGNGLAAIVSLEYTPPASLDEHGSPIVGFDVSWNLKALNKRVSLFGWRESRVESSFRATLSLFKYFDFVNSIDLVYDSDIAYRRELRTNLSFNIRYNLDLSSGS